MNTIRVVALAAFSSLAFAQQLPQFEVASIKPSHPGADFHVDLGYHIDGAMVSFKTLSLRDYLRLAYLVKDYQIVAPEWLAQQRFDITAKLPDGGKESQVRDMLKSLLADRFHLKLHKDSKDFSVYGLVVMKSGAKLTETEGEHVTEAPTNMAASGGAEGVNINLGHGSSFTFADNQLQAKGLNMDIFTNLLARFMDRPVVDMTGLTKFYDMTLKVTPEDYLVMQIHAAVSAGVTLPPQALHLLEMPSGDSLHSALAAVGLKLEPRKAPVETIVVDSADKTPTEN